MKIEMKPVDRLPSSRSRKDYEGQAADILKELNKLDDGSSVLVGKGNRNEVATIAVHLRKALGKSAVVVRSEATGSDVFELYATAGGPF